MFPLKPQFSLILLLTILFTWGCRDSSDIDRPANELLLDNAHILSDISESVTNQLHHIRNSYDIEVILASVSDIGAGDTIQSLTARLFTDWDIGRSYSGRGILILLADNQKEVRLEVGLALEAVFTDLFTGYIEEKQLKSYFASGQLEVGLIAVLEEIEARASLLAGGDLSREKIDALDLHFLSSGGGADVQLQKYLHAKPHVQPGYYPAGQTPAQAWQTLLQSWRDKNRDWDIGVYTPATRLIYRAFTNQPERRFEEDERTWGSKPFEIIHNENFAVVFFGKKKGWQNAPFLFCRTKDGWQFDMVHQRKIVRMGQAPHWGIERGEHPYIQLLKRCPYWMGQDIPRRGGDIYDISRDHETAQTIITLEQQLKNNPRKFDTLLQLGSLYTLTSMSQKRFSLLQAADTIQKDHPDVIKNLAIAHVDAHYQYNTALKLMNRYVALRPADPFGHFYQGYLLLMKHQPENAILSLKKGLTLEPADIYGLCKLARAYIARNRDGDRARAAAIVTQLEHQAPGNIRLSWLKQAMR